MLSFVQEIFRLQDENLHLERDVSRLRSKLACRQVRERSSTIPFKNSIVSGNIRPAVAKQPLEQEYQQNHKYQQYQNSIEYLKDVATLHNTASTNTSYKKNLKMAYLDKRDQQNFLSTCSENKRLQQKDRCIAVQSFEAQHTEGATIVPGTQLNAMLEAIDEQKLCQEQLTPINNRLQLNGYQKQQKQNEQHQSESEISYTPLRSCDLRVKNSLSISTSRERSAFPIAATPILSNLISSQKGAYYKKRQQNNDYCERKVYDQLNEQNIEGNCTQIERNYSGIEHNSPQTKGYSLTGAFARAADSPSSSSSSCHLRQKNYHNNFQNVNSNKQDLCSFQEDRNNQENGFENSSAILCYKLVAKINGEYYSIYGGKGRSKFVRGQNINRPFESCDATTMQSSQGQRLRGGLVVHTSREQALLARFPTDSLYATDKFAKALMTILIPAKSQHVRVNRHCLVVQLCTAVDFEDIN